MVQRCVSKVFDHQLPMWPWITSYIPFSVIETLKGTHGHMAGAEAGGKEEGEVEDLCG